jgi:malonyl-CoA O-methyltransferase
MPLKADQIDNRAGYDQWAATYDFGVNSTVYVDELYFPKLWQGLSPRRVVELGCGTGRHTLKLAQDGHEVTALDLSAGMLTVAHHRLNGYDKVHFVEADILNQDMAALGVFDMAVCALVLEHIADLPLFFSQMARGIKDGGRLYVSEIHPARIAKGTQARFTDDDTGKTHLLTSHAHGADALMAAAHDAGFRTLQKSEIFGDAEMAAKHPQWQKHLGQPLIWMLTFEKGA